MSRTAAWMLGQTEADLYQRGTCILRFRRPEFETKPDVPGWSFLNSRDHDWTGTISGWISHGV
jgi:hypothetical protein